MKKITNLLYWFAMVGLFFWFAYSKGWILTNFQSIDAAQAIQLLDTDDNLTLLDVRTIGEYKEGHLRDATLIPLQSLRDNLGMIKEDKDKKILVYCRSGSRSISAARILEENGFTPINVKGGIMALSKENVEIIK